jgi:hypothetical protein
MNLPAGNYSVMITDADGATISASVEITQPPVLTATTASTAATHANANGSATVTANGGVEPYNYLWNTVPPATTATAANIVAGNYTVVVTDANGCTLSATTTVDMETGISELFERSLSIVPSPASEWFSIQSDDAQQFSNIQLMDAKGRVVQSWKEVEKGQLLVLNQVPDGQYWVLIADGERSATKKLIVLR